MAATDHLNKQQFGKTPVPPETSGMGPSGQFGLPAQAAGSLYGYFR